MVIALVGLIFILLLVFVLIIRGQSKKYSKKSDSGKGGRAVGGDRTLRSLSGGLSLPLGSGWSCGNLPSCLLWERLLQCHPVTMLWNPGERRELRMK